MDFSIFSSFLPTGLLSHFDIVDFKELGDLQTKKDCFYIYLDEKNILPKNYDSNEFESKGFYERALIQDFPIRGKAVYLGIRRRRWRNKNHKSIEVKSDYSFIAEGSKLNQLSEVFYKKNVLKASRLLCEVSRLRTRSNRQQTRCNKLLKL